MKFFKGWLSYHIKSCLFFNFSIYLSTVYTLPSIYITTYLYIYQTFLTFIYLFFSIPLLWMIRPCYNVHCTMGWTASFHYTPPLPCQLSGIFYVFPNIFNTGWPVIHGRVFLAPCEKCTLVQWRTLDKYLYTRYKKPMAMFIWPSCIWVKVLANIYAWFTFKLNRQRLRMF